MIPRILVIDDQESLCDILQYNLKKEGYVVDCACDAMEALQKDLSVYQLLIVDIDMPRITGLEFVERIRQKEDTQHIPVIFCSAFSQEDVKVKGLDLGADDYITKPFIMSVVLKRVQSVLQRCYPEEFV